LDRPLAGEPPGAPDPRRADDRARPRRAARALAAGPRAARRRHDRAPHHALHGRGGAALRPHRRARRGPRPRGGCAGAARPRGARRGGAGARGRAARRGGAARRARRRAAGPRRSPAHALRRRRGRPAPGAAPARWRGRAAARGRAAREPRGPLSPPDRHAPRGRRAWGGGAVSVSARHTIAVWHRNFAMYRRTWKLNLLPNFFEPLLYLASIGIGVGAYVQSMGGTSYVAFLAPGLVAVSAMNGASFEVTYNSFVRLNYEKTYESM